jgi:hypothetical protein
VQIVKLCNRTGLQIDNDTQNGIPQEVLIRRGRSLRGKGRLNGKR